MATEQELIEAAELLEAVTQRNDELKQELAQAKVRMSELENANRGLQRGNSDTRQANVALEKANKLLEAQLRRSREEVLREALEQIRDGKKTAAEALSEITANKVIDHVVNGGESGNDEPDVTVRRRDQEPKDK